MSMTEKVIKLFEENFGEMTGGVGGRIVTDIVQNGNKVEMVISCDAWDDAVEADFYDYTEMEGKHNWTWCLNGYCSDDLVGDFDDLPAHSFIELVKREIGAREAETAMRKWKGSTGKTKIEIGSDAIGSFEFDEKGGIHIYIRHKGE